GRWRKGPRQNQPRVPANQHRQSAAARDSSKYVFDLPKNPFLDLATRAVMPVLNTGPSHSARPPFSSCPSPYLASAFRFVAAGQRSAPQVLAASPQPSSPEQSPSYPRTISTQPPSPGPK